LSVFIERGTREEDIITLIGEGNQSFSKAPGDVNIIIRQEPHPIFKRTGDDLIVNLELNLEEALFGFKKGNNYL
jgi:DnaJ family protein A protein 1